MCLESLEMAATLSVSASAVGVVGELDLLFVEAPFNTNGCNRGGGLEGAVSGTMLAPTAKSFGSRQIPLPAPSTSTVSRVAARWPGGLVYGFAVTLEGRTP